jgi:hypothetical protein
MSTKTTHLDVDHKEVGLKELQHQVQIRCERTATRFLPHEVGADQDHKTKPWVLLLMERLDPVDAGQPKTQEALLILRPIARLPYLRWLVKAGRGHAVSWRGRGVCEDADGHGQRLRAHRWCSGTREGSAAGATGATERWGSGGGSRGGDGDG